MSVRVDTKLKSEAEREAWAACRKSFSKTGALNDDQMRMYEARIAEWCCTKDLAGKIDPHLLLKNPEQGKTDPFLQLHVPTFPLEPLPGWQDDLMLKAVETNNKIQSLLLSQNERLLQVYMSPW